MKTDYRTGITAYLDKLKQTIDQIPVDELNILMNVLEEARVTNRTIFVMGNGGSSATASHYVCDFNKGVSSGHEKKYKWICLNDNVPSLMAYANDLSFEEIFVEQLKNFFREGDIVIGISGSGNSRNVLKAIEYARIKGGITVGLTGFKGGQLREMVDYSVHIPVEDMQIAEDLHMVLDHCMMKILGCKDGTY